MIMRRHLRARAGIGAALVTLLLAGCATPLSTEVTAFHRLAPEAGAVAGQRFRIVPAAGQESGLAFANYADRVRQELVARGAIDAGDQSADWTVALRYAETLTALQPRSHGSSGGVSIGAGVGGGVSFGIGLGIPIGGRPAPEASRVRYDLWMTVDAVRAEGGRLYEGQASGEGPIEGGLPSAMPALVRALFTDFPGRSGVMRRVEVPLEKP